MANTIKHKRGSGSNPTASDLEVGELAIRTDTGAVFTKKDDDSVTEVTGASTVDKISEGNTEAEVVDTGSDGHFKVTTEGTERLRVDSSGTVKIGSNTTVAPNSNANSLVIDTGVNDSGINILSSASARIFFGDADANNSGRIMYVHSDNHFRFYTAGSERLRIDGSGNLGVGTSDPIFLTDILSGTANTGANADNPSQLSITGANKTLTGGGATVFINSNSDLAADTGGSIAFSGRDTTSSTNSIVHATIKGAKESATSANGDSYLAFATQNHSAGALVERMRIDSSGRVGIGTTSLSSMLNVNGSIRLGTGSTLQSGSSGGTVQIQGGATFPGGNILLGGGSGNDDIRFRTSGSSQTSTERIRIDSSGRLLVGHSSPAGDNNMFEVATTYGGRIGFVRNDTSTSEGNNLGMLCFYGNDSNGTYQESARIEVSADGDHATDDKPGRIEFKTTADGGSSPTERMRIDSSGNVGIGTSSAVNRLDVDGSISASGTLGNTGYAPAVHIGLSGDNPSIASGNNVSGTFLPLVFRRETTTGAAESMRIDSSGRLGLGTSSPSVELSIAGSDPQLCIWEGSDGDSSSKVQLGTGTTQGFVNIQKGDGTRTVQINSDGDSFFNGGDVGIGTASPAHLLDLNDSSSAYIRQTRGSTTLRIGPLGSSATSGAIIATETNGPLTFATNGLANERMRIDSAGRLGIGVTPSNFGTGRNSLELHSASATVTHLALTNSTTNSNGSSNGFNIIQNGLNTLLFLRESGFMSFSTANTERMRIDNSGQVMIGATSAAGLFSVHQSASSTANYINITNNATGSSSWSNGMLLGNNTSGDALCWQNENLNLLFGTNNSERMRIDSSGNLGIGTSSPIFTTDILSGAANTGSNVNNPSQLSVTGPNKSLTGGGATVFVNSNSDLAADTGGSIAFTGRNTTSSTNSIVHATIKGAKENATSTNENAYLGLAVRNHNTGGLVERMRIDSSGNVGIGTTSPTENLHVYDSGFSSVVIQSDRSSGTIGGLILQDSSGNNKANVYGEVGGELVLGTDGDERMRIDSSGHVSIGTTTATSGRNITMAASTDAGIQITGASSGTNVYITATPGSSAATYIGNTNSRNLHFVVGGSTSSKMSIDSSGNLKFNSGFGSVATAYGVRAWASWRGDITSGSSSQLDASGNISSITDNGTGDYTMNFTNAMPDTFYVVAGNVIEHTSGNRGDHTLTIYRTLRATGSVRVNSVNFSGSPVDDDFIFAAIIR